MTDECRPAGAETLSIDLTARSRAISPDLWGIFFEDLNHAADGGLYAELLVNPGFDYRTFRDATDERLTGWSAWPTSESAVPVTVHDRGARRAQSPWHVVLGPPPERAEGVSNAGLEGLHVEAGLPYAVEILARSATGEGSSIGVFLEDSAGVLSPLGAPIRLGSAWSQLDLVVTPGRSSAQGRLVVRWVEGGSAAVDRVSLLPVARYGAAALPLRIDLAEAIAELRPRFVRFPGGCLVHGSGPDNLYRWKDTLGPVADRRTKPNLWGYHQTMGLGYFEYFQLCAELGAQPIPVVAAGVCCQNSPRGQEGLPESAMDDYVGEVLDLIEFANGDTFTTWGKVRAELGRGQPFGLRYLGIGNEDEVTPLFRERFARLCAAVAAAQPEIAVIGTAGPFPEGADFEEGWALARQARLHVVDEHSYKSPRCYFQNLDRFDGYDRGGPAVYLGEYAAKTNTMRSALAEAAYMIGLERNGDVVRLASYAPLLGRVGGSQWTPDLLYFTETAVLRTLNYYVQQLHSLAAGDEVLAVTTSVSRPVPPQRGAWITLEVGCQRLAATVSLVEAQGLVAETPGVSHAVLADAEPQLLAAAASAETYCFRLRVRKTAGTGSLEVTFGDREVGSPYRWDIGGWSGRSLQLWRVDDGIATEISDGVPFSFEEGRDYELEVRVDGARMVCLLDDVVVHAVVDDTRPEQRFIVSAMRERDTGRVHVKAVNATDEPVVVAVGLLSGGVGHHLTVTALSTSSLEAGSPYEASPSVPVTEDRGVVRDEFVATFDARSFSIHTLTPGVAAATQPTGIAASTSGTVRT